MPLKISQLPPIALPMTGDELLIMARGGKTWHGRALDLIVNLLTAPVVNVFSGTGAPAVYTLSAVPTSKEGTDVHVGPDYVHKSAYTIVGNQLTLNASAGVNNVEVVIYQLIDYISLQALVQAAADSAEAADLSAENSENSAQAAIDYATLAGTAAGGEGFWTERNAPADGWTWVVNFGSPITAVRSIFDNGRRQRLSNFTITTANGTIQANAGYLTAGVHQIDINWV